MAFEELNLNQNGTIKGDANNEPEKVGSVSGKAFKFGLDCLIKKVTKMQLLINKLLLKGFKGVSDLKYDEKTLSFSYCPLRANQGQNENDSQTSIRITIENLLH